MNINKLRMINPIFVLLFFCLLSVNASGQPGNTNSGPLGSAGSSSTSGKTSKTKKTAAKKSTKSKAAKKSTANSSETTYELGSDDLIGTWRTVVNEQGQSLQIDVTFSSDGTTDYFISDAQGRTARQNGKWSYSNGILYERFQNGLSGRGSIAWTDRNSFTITIIDNGDPAYRGVKRRYKRIG